MDNETDCKGCNHMRACLTASKYCPCRICLVRVMCQQFCYERHCIGAKFLKLTPISEEAFERIRRMI